MKILFDIFRSVLIVSILLMPAASMAQKIDIDQLAYRVYVGCLNEYLRMLEKGNEDRNLRIELEGCRDLSLEILSKSKSNSGTRYLALLLLLNTDGSDSEKLSIEISKKKNQAKRFQNELRLVSEQGKCFDLSVVKITKSSDLCADPERVKRSMEIIFSEQ